MEDELTFRQVIDGLSAGTREGDGIALRNCPPYIREWIVRDEGQP